MGWGRLIVLGFLGFGLSSAGAPWPVIVAAVLFVGAAFMEIDVVRLKREASNLRDRMEALESELEQLRRPGVSRSVPSLHV